MWSEWWLPDAGMLSEQLPKFREAYSAILQGTFISLDLPCLISLFYLSFWQLAQRCLPSKAPRRFQEKEKNGKSKEDVYKMSWHTFQCPNLKLTEIKYKEDDVHQLFGLLSGIWRNLRKTTIILTKAWSIKSQYPFAMLLTSSSFEIWHDLCHLPLSYQARCLGFGVSLDVGWQQCLPSKYLYFLSMKQLWAYDLICSGDRWLMGWWPLADLMNRSELLCSPHIWRMSLESE